MARMLVPPTDEPWYRAARPGMEGAGPEALAAPVVVWSLARGGPDPEFVAAAAASLARLTHTDPAQIAGACLYAVALQEAHVPRPSADSLSASLAGWIALARRWGGAAPPDTVIAAVGAAARVLTEPLGARAEWMGPMSGELAGGLVAPTIGVPLSTVPPSIVDALAAVDRAR
jgi:hypothetical protein